MEQIKLINNYGKYTFWYRLGYLIILIPYGLILLHGSKDDIFCVTLLILTWLLYAIYGMINKRNKLRLINIEKDAYIKNLKKETLFETYEDLPQWLKNELFIRHIHADTGCDEDKPYNEKRVKIVYTEQSVIEIINLLHNKIK